MMRLLARAECTNVETGRCAVYPGWPQLRHVPRPIPVQSCAGHGATPADTTWSLTRMNAAPYVAPKIWTWNPGNGGPFANLNRPTAGATHDKPLPVGRHPLQLYSL